MGDNWYCLIFGEELGPMSWDDLVNMAAHGMLSRSAKVKRGPQEDWVQADSIDGLFATSPPTVGEDSTEHAAGLHVGSTWYCEVLGNELGPFTWAELLEMAQRGQLTRTQQVRQERETNWTVAEQIQGLFVGPATNEKTDFDVAVPSSTQIVKPELSSDNLDFDVAPSVGPTHSDDTEFEVSQQENRPAATTISPSDDEDFEIDVSLSKATAPDDDDFEIASSVPSAPADDDEFDLAGGTLPAHDRGADIQPAAGSPVASLTSVAAPEPATDGASQATPAKADSPVSGPVKAKKKRAEKRPRQKAAKSASAGLSQDSKRAVLGTIGIASLAGLAYVAYLGIAALASMRSVNYDEIQAGYDQLFQQAKQAQTDTSISSDPHVAAQFLAKVNELRGPLQSAPPGSVDAQLFEAGTMLVELYAAAAAAANTPAGKERKATEDKYLSKIASIRSELAPNK